MLSKIKKQTVNITKNGNVVQRPSTTEVISSKMEFVHYFQVSMAARSRHHLMNRSWHDLRLSPWGRIQTKNSVLCVQNLCKLSNRVMDEKIWCLDILNLCGCWDSILGGIM